MYSELKAQVSLSRGIIKNIKQTHTETPRGKSMNEVRIVVKWLIGQIKTYSKFVSLKPQIKIDLSTDRKIFPVGGLLQTAQTCLYGN